MTFQLFTEKNMFLINRVSRANHFDIVSSVRTGRNLPYITANSANVIVDGTTRFHTGT